MIKNTDFLIVEDEFLIGETIVEILTNAGAKKIRFVNSVQDALTEIEICKP